MQAECIATCIGVTVDLLWFLKYKGEVESFGGNLDNPLFFFVCYLVPEVGEDIYCVTAHCFCVASLFVCQARALKGQRYLALEVCWELGEEKAKLQTLPSHWFLRLFGFDSPFLPLFIYTTEKQH